MKWGLEIREYHVLETQMNLTSDFTGSRERISTITSIGRRSSISKCLAEAALLNSDAEASSKALNQNIGLRSKEITRENGFSLVLVNLALREKEKEKEKEEMGVYLFSFLIMGKIIMTANKTKQNKVTKTRLNQNTNKALKSYQRN